LIKPIVEIHDGIHVVRDDLYPGGTKARYIEKMFGDAEELVYATPCEGGAQTALAYVAKKLGKRATIFCAARKQKHPRVAMGESLGAQYHFVSPGYLNVVQARAEEYCDRTGATLTPFGVNTKAAIDTIAEAALETGLVPDEVWCAAGSGVLSRSLAKAWPWSARYSVQVGRELSYRDVDNAVIVNQPLPFSRATKAAVPFPSDPHYDAKAWSECVSRRGGGTVLFWNVTGPAQA
jgi:phosphoribosylpyrophosphate synthetase